MKTTHSKLFLACTALVFGMAGCKDGTPAANGEAADGPVAPSSTAEGGNYQFSDE